MYSSSAVSGHDDREAGLDVGLKSSGGIGVRVSASGDFSSARVEREFSTPVNLEPLDLEQLHALERATSGFLSLERLELLAASSDIAAWQLEQLERLEGFVGVADLELLLDVSLAWRAEAQPMTAARTRKLAERFADALRGVTPLRFTAVDVQLVALAVHGARCLDMPQRAAAWRLAQTMRRALGLETIPARYVVTPEGAAALASLEQLELLEGQADGWAHA